MLAPHLKKLRDTTSQLFHGEIPGWLRTRYRNLASPMFKWWGLLMTNTRMLVLFAFLFIGQPIYYFWLELTPLNLLFVYLIIRQENMSESLLEVAVGWGEAGQTAHLICVGGRKFLRQVTPGLRVVFLNSN